MSKRKSVVFLVLLFLLISVSLFAGKGPQQGNRNLDETEFRGRGVYALAEEETSSTQKDAVMGRRMNQVQNTPNIEDCQYLETGERLFLTKKDLYKEIVVNNLIMKVE